MTSSDYPLINALENSENLYRQHINDYSILYGQYLDDKVDKNAVGMEAKKKQMEQILVAMKSTLDDMNGILNQAYQMGMTNQTYSAQASNALQIQAALMDERMRQYNEARDRLAHLVGEEATTATLVTQSRAYYSLYFALALGLSISIVYTIMGGTFPSGVLIILVIIGLFFGWEFYKAWIGKVGDVIQSGASNVKGVFRLVT